jgi:hypothetical protein
MHSPGIVHNDSAKKGSHAPGLPSTLTPLEMANAKAAIRFVAVKLGGSAKLAAALEVTRASIDAARLTRGRLSAGLALRVARLAGVPLEDVLSGAWPKPGSCPHCGRD